MSSTVLEKARMMHAEMDACERSVVDRLKNPPRTHRERIYQEHRVKKLVNEIVTTGHKLNEIYEDATNVRRDELAAMQGMNALSIFYDRLKDIRELHRRTGAEESAVVAEGMDMDLMDEEVPVQFSGPEGYGRYLDLTVFHMRSLNMKQFDHSLDYLNFLRVFYKFDRVPKDTKNAEYRHFLSDLYDYLYDYLQRVQPLFDAAIDIARTEKEFNEAWISGNVPGWSVEDAKEETNPLWCDACQHLFAKETVFKAHLTGKKHIKAAAARKAENGGSNGPTNNQKREIAKFEYLITHLVGILSQKLEDTISFVQKKQASTYEELEADLLDMEEENEEPEAMATAEEEDQKEDDSEDKPIYNPLNLPLGWDGKPIPYWLWKLHGLGVEYKCEICGNHSYWGRRNFERHFQEWRHQHGMRCLKIPNTKHFQDVTAIEDAYALYEKLKREGTLREWNPEKEEEVEDAEGRVYSRKIFEDMRRQGLI